MVFACVCMGHHGVDGVVVVHHFIPKLMGTLLSKPWGFGVPHRPFTTRWCPF